MVVRLEGNRRRRVFGGRGEKGGVWSHLTPFFCFSFGLGMACLDRVQVMDDG
jgi:hypothetical protein